MSGTPENKPNVDMAPTIPDQQEVAPGNVAAAGASWQEGVCRAHTRRARKAALSLYRKNPGMTKEQLKAALQNHPEIVGLDVATILTLITLAIKLYALWQSRKAAAKDIPEDPDDPRAAKEPQIEMLPKL